VIDSLTGQGINVRQACRALGVSESGYYAWKGRPDPPRTLRRIWLAGEIADVHKASGGTYGYMRVTAELRHGREIVVGHNTVGKIMGEPGIKGLPTRRLPKGARMARVTSLDLVRRVFRREGPNQLWMTDITEHPTREGKVYCCVVLDAFSRLVVGWSVECTQTTVLVTNALGMATSRRDRAEGLVIHSNRGVQFTSWAFSHKVRDAGLAPSMGAVGSAYDKCDGRVLLGADAGRALQPQTLEDPDRARQRHSRLHRAVPQHPPPALGARDAHPDRVRGSTQRNPGRLTLEPRLRFFGGRSKSPWNPAWLIPILRSTKRSMASSARRASST
jgi:Integrase core domain/HTH-like domain